MKLSPIEQKIKDVIAPAATDLDLAIVLVRVTNTDRGQVVEVLAEDPKTKNLDIESCAKLTREVSVLLDVEDVIDGKYTLEVSSPGIDRPLVTSGDFDHYQGHEVKVELEQPNQDGQKRFRGCITAVKGEDVTLQNDQGEVTLNIGDMAKAKLVMKDELLKESLKAKA